MSEPVKPALTPEELLQRLEAESKILHDAFEKSLAPFREAAAAWAQALKNSPEMQAFLRYAALPPEDV